MRPGRRYTLERRGEVLGTLTVTETEMFHVYGTFAPTPAFGPYRPLFDEDARLSALLEDDDDPALLEAGDAVQAGIQALGLVLRSPQGTGHREMLLHIGGEHAGFRPLNPEEESL